jgi:Dolichyl-phosphate-mannose-protein mannosyltransferase
MPRRNIRFKLLFLIVALCYLTGLGSLYLPSNGDEMVYSRIARLTAQSGHWLPLVSDLEHMRNTKPPLLFWQAMLAGDWGQHWDLARLRLPSVIYTLLIAACVGWTTWLAARRQDLAWISACVYLAFFSSFRYGRPYLTSAAETFWLALPMWGVLWRGLRSDTSKPTPLPRWPLVTLWGLAWGLGLAYKSFALVAPAGASLWCTMLILHRNGRWSRVLGITLRAAWCSALALGVFGLWFVLDPQPQAVWQEFVVGENGGKLATSTGPWWGTLKNVLLQALATVENAGLLAGVVLGLMALGVQAALTPALSRKREREKDKLPSWLVPALVVWLLVWGVVFCIPSQRSARYVIPAMPALAVLIALYWHRLARGWFMVTLVLCLPVLLLLGRVAQTLHTQGLGSTWEGGLALVALAVGLMAVLGGLVRPHWTRPSALVASIAVYALLNSTLAPLSGPAGQFAGAKNLITPNAHIAVPSTFNAQYERYQFLLPHPATLHIAPYTPAQEALQLPALLTAHDAVVWQQTGADALPACAQTTPVTCRVLSQRWDIKSRHQPGEIRLGNVLYPEQWLLRREWLLTQTS